MRRAATRLVIAAVLVLLALAALGMVVNLTAPPVVDQGRLAQAISLFSALVYGALGGFLALCRPRHPAGWLLTLIAVSLTADSLGVGVVQQAEGGASWARGLVPWGAWLDNWTWPGQFAGIIVLLLRFPDGRLSGRTGRIVEIGSIVVCVGTALLAAVSVHATDYPDVELPIDLGVISRLPVPTGRAFIPLLVAIAVAVVGLLRRRRRATGAERAQLRWLFWAAALLAGTATVALMIQATTALGLTPASAHDLWDPVVQLSFYSVPIAVAVAVNRYGLFEIDRVIGRSVSYSLLTTVLTATYVVIVTAVSALVPDELGSLAVVAATLAVAALFVPARRRIQHAVDRRFNRSPFDADAVVTAFAERTRGPRGQATTEEDLVLAVGQVFQPAHAGVWLAPTRRTP